MKAFEITVNPLDPEKYRQFVLHRSAGAVNVFTGHVREWTDGIRTLYLQYEAYIPMAEKKLQEIGEEIKEKWPDVCIAMVHRIGKLHIMDIAVVVAISAAHRYTAFQATEYAINRLKEVVPIWKKEIREHSEEWIGEQKQRPDKEYKMK